MGMNCDECGDVEDTYYCEKCRDKYHEKQCDKCDRVSPDDCGYCPDCNRSDCSDCDYYSPDDYGEVLKDKEELQEYLDERDQYEEYLQDKLEARGIDFLDLPDFLLEEKDNVPGDGPSEELRQEKRNDEREDDPDEIERRLDEAEARRKAKSTD